jgi:hypothetical protein
MLGNHPKPDKQIAEHAPYCAFKNDRDRLLALVSRDIRKVLIVIVLAMVAGPPVVARLPVLWSAVLASL